MRYIELKMRKLHGNGSWRRTGYTEVTGGKSYRDGMLEFRENKTSDERRKFNMLMSAVVRHPKRYERLSNE